MLFRTSANAWQCCGHLEVLANSKTIQGARRDYEYAILDIHLEGFTAS